MIQEHSLKIIKLKEVAKKTSLSTNSILKLMRESDFPQRIALTDNNKRFGWMESEVDSWLLCRRDGSLKRAELSKHGK